MKRIHNPMIFLRIEPIMKSLQAELKCYWFFNRLSNMKSIYEACSILLSKEDPCLLSSNIRLTKFFYHIANNPSSIRVLQYLAAFFYKAEQNLMVNNILIGTFS
jgi:hypothetical protein